MLTVEDPVEYELAGIGQTQVNPKIDLTFAKALRAILRQDPDVIMIGEIRDFETAQIAIQASLTGHLVLATLHTNDAPSRRDPPDRHGRRAVPAQLVSLLGVLAQRLVRKLCPHCKRADARGRYHPVGCAACGNTGYKGRTGVYELMVADDKVRSLIHSRAAEAAALRRRRGRRPALDARGRRAAGRRRHHLARRSDAGDARVTMPSCRARPALRATAALDRRPRVARTRRCPPTSSKPSTPPASPRPACSTPTTRSAARAQLRAQSLVPLAVTQVAAAGTQAGGLQAVRGASSAPPASPCWTRQLAGLVGSGLPLERALTALSDEAEDPRQRELVAHLRSEVNAGSPFARALAQRAARVRRGLPRRGRRRRAERRARRACSSAWPTTSRSARS